MEVIYLLLPLSLGLALVAVAGFLWANKNKQFDDLETPASRILLGDTPPTGQEATERCDSSPTDEL